MASPRDEIIGNGVVRQAYGKAGYRRSDRAVRDDDPPL